MVQKKSSWVACVGVYTCVCCVACVYRFVVVVTLHPFSSLKIKALKPFDRHGHGLSPMELNTLKPLTT